MAYMRKACRRTCGLCFQGNNQTEVCADKDGNCTLKENDCYLETTAAQMYQSCRRTCGYCTGYCADVAVNCADLVPYCLASSWHQAVMRSKCRMSCSFCRLLSLLEVMSEECAHSCGYCDYFDSIEDIPRECMDKSSECGAKRHLCYVKGWRSNWMWRFCPRTCGYCPAYYF
ncbi:unnamed protein product [Gongylonema pulchrum]|uniref:ShKT domain-containing protein n=1 Tax=Gongylonema pulchrum TaxID=637853 RepID=A0A3P7N3L8_9BILA|nr:unnamed protein product [Gongylonema pulchrum]